MQHYYSHGFRSDTEVGLILEDMCPVPQSYEIFSYNDEQKVLEYGTFWSDEYVSQGKANIDLAHATVEQRNADLREIYN